MSWRKQWQAISSRIAGLRTSGEFLISTLKVSSDDAYGSTARVIAQAIEAVTALESFLASYRSQLPPLFVMGLDTFLAEDGDRLRRSCPPGFHGVQFAITALISVHTALEYYITDFSAAAARRTERAFVHLQSLLRADQGVRSAWLQAFQAHEPTCERLGAAHLLAHGIWSFKASGAGACTDLVLGESEIDTELVERTADALVLTEWKLIRVPNEAEREARAARAQAALYSTGLMGGIELREYRYLILISLDYLPSVTDFLDPSGVSYRVINIALQPSSPSRASRHTTA